MYASDSKDTMYELNFLACIVSIAYSFSSETTTFAFIQIFCEGERNELNLDQNV